MPALGPTDTFNQPFFTQYHEDLIEILLWNVLPCGNICAFNRPLPMICCHIEHGSQAIISLHCKLHCRAGPFCRAKCLIFEERLRAQSPKGDTVNWAPTTQAINCQTDDIYD